MFEVRLGDVIDDYCIKCRRLTNHSIVSILNAAAAKVRCRTCYNDHDYRNEIAPPTKKELKKLALFNEALASGAELDPMTAASALDEAPVELAAASSAVEEPAEVPAPKKAKSKASKAK